MPFTTYSTVFDGSDGTHRGSDLTGSADSKLGLLSFWIKVGAGGDATTDYLFTSDSLFLQVIRSSSGGISIEANNAGNTKILWLDMGASVVNVSDGWCHIAMSWDLSTAGRRKVYRNGTDVTNENTFTNDTIDYTRPDWQIGLGSGFPINVLISEFYFTIPAAYYDLSSAPNLVKFYSSGNAVDLGSDGSTPTGTAPLLYMRNQSGGSPDFLTNQGTGGNFTVTNGALTDGGSDKPPGGGAPAATLSPTTSYFVGSIA